MGINMHTSKHQIQSSYLYFCPSCGRRINVSLNTIFCMSSTDPDNSIENVLVDFDLSRSCDIWCDTCGLKLIHLSEHACKLSEKLIKLGVHGSIDLGSVESIREGGHTISINIPNIHIRIDDYNDHYRDAINTLLILSKSEKWNGRISDFANNNGMHGMFFPVMEDDISYENLQEYYSEEYFNKVSTAVNKGRKILEEFYEEFIIELEKVLEKKTASTNVEA